jgi:hypothetical protein
MSLLKGFAADSSSESSSNLRCEAIFFFATPTERMAGDSRLLK